MITWLLLMPAAAIFIAINIIIGCYAMIRLGYGPPDWRTALNLIVRVTTLQDRLNEGRNRLEQKAPWADKLLDRLGVPKPIVIVEIPIIEETDEEAADEQSENISGVASEESLDTQESSVTQSSIAQESSISESKQISPNESAITSSIAH